eukprot:PhM_4_TR8894/c0_g1_i1/m.65248
MKKLCLALGISYDGHNGSTATSNKKKGTNNNRKKPPQSSSSKSKSKPTAAKATARAAPAAAKASSSPQGPVQISEPVIESFESHTAFPFSALFSQQQLQQQVHLNASGSSASPMPSFISAHPSFCEPHSLRRKNHSMKPVAQPGNSGLSAAATSSTSPPVFMPPTPSPPPTIGVARNIGSPMAVDHLVVGSRVSGGDEILLHGVDSWLPHIRELGLPTEVSTRQGSIISTVLVSESKRRQRILEGGGGGAGTSSTHSSECRTLPLDTEDPRAHYTNLVRIADGASGVVYRALCNELCEDVAIKRVPVTDDASLQRVSAEVHIMQGLDHPCVVRFIRAHRYDDEAWIVMELMEHGSLSEYIEHSLELDTFPFLGEMEVLYVLQSVARGLAYLHSVGRMHRDIKTDNVFISHKGEVKLGDFGSACPYTPGTTLDEVVGTPHWMAPEIVACDPYTNTADSWSLGILAHELVTGDPPYIDEEPVKALYNIIANDSPRLPASSAASPALREVVGALLTKDAAVRITPEMALGYPVFIRNAAALSSQACVDGLTTKLIDIKRAYDSLLLRESMERKSSLMGSYSGAGMASLSPM